MRFVRSIYSTGHEPGSGPGAGAAATVAARPIKAPKLAKRMFLWWYNFVNCLGWLSVYPSSKLRGSRWFIRSFHYCEIGVEVYELRLLKQSGFCYTLIVQYILKGPLESYLSKNLSQSSQFLKLRCSIPSKRLPCLCH